MARINCVEPGTLVMDGCSIPEPSAKEVLIRIRRVGICGTDFHIVRGTQPFLSYPRVPGHELAGEVVVAPAGSDLRPGDQVCVMPYHACGACTACRKGKSNCCTTISVLGVHKDGGLAQFITVDEQYVIAAPGLTLDEVALVEFLSIGRHAVCRGQVAPSDRVLVVGAGPIGMAVCFFAARAGAVVTVLEGNAERAAICFDRLGANYAVPPGDDAAERLAEVTSGDFFDIVFDATGNVSAMEGGFAFVAHGGSYVLVSVVTADVTFSDPEFHKREMSLLGSRNATQADFAAVIDVLKTRQFPIDAVISHWIPFADAAEEIQRLMQLGSGVVKALVMM